MRDGQLYGRYTITHKDGKPIDPHRRYFVLSPQTDPHAVPAIMAYVKSCAKTHPVLAKSIIAEYALALPLGAYRELFGEEEGSLGSPE